jgi:hypothetical protein
MARARERGRDGGREGEEGGEKEGGKVVRERMRERWRFKDNVRARPDPMSFIAGVNTPAPNGRECQPPDYSSTRSSWL